MAKLVINPTSAAKKEIPLAGQVLSIGRDPSNDLVLSDSMVSRRHAVLERRDEKFVLRDNNSSNGTMVNGDRVYQEQTLQDGDLVSIGSSRMLFRADDSASEPLAAPPVPPPPAQPMPPTEPVSPHQKNGLRCPSCGKSASPEDRFCRGCGKVLVENEGAAKCERCGATVDLPAEFCGTCGHRLAGARAGSAMPTEANSLEELLSGLPPSAASRKQGDASRPKLPPARRAPRPVRSGEPAGFWIRLVAYLLDQLILATSLLLAFLLWSTLAVGGGEQQDVAVSALPALLSLGFVFLAIYFIYFWGARGATPGKSLLGLEVQTESGESPIGYSRAAIRLVGYLLSSMIFNIGFLMIAFSADKRGLHDRIAGTCVVRKS